MSYEKVGRAMSWNLVAKMARFLAGPVSYMIVVRSLGTHNWGVLSVLKTIESFALIVIALGAGNALLKYLPALRVSGGVPSFINTFKKMILLQTAVWAVLIWIAWMTRGVISRFYDVSSAGFGIFLVVSIALTIFKVMMSMATNLLQSWYETKRLSIAIVIGNICYIVIMMLFLKAGFGIVGYLAAGAVVDLGTTVFLVPQIYRFLGSEPKKEGEAPGFRQVMAFSLPFVVTGFLNQIVWRHSEVLFLGKFRGMESSGFFGLAYDIPQMALEFIPLTIWPIVMAGTSEVYSRDHRNLSQAVDLYFRLLFILVVPVASMGFAFSREMVPILFGRQMLPAALMTQLFFVVFSYSFLYTPLSMALYVMEKSWVNMLVFAFMAVLNIGMDFALIPAYGIWGAFFPIVIILGIEVAVFALVIRKFDKDIRIPAVFIIKCYAAALPTACLALSSARWNSIPALIVQMAAGLLLLVAGFRIMRVLGEKEKELILKLPLPFKEKIAAIF